MFRIVVSSVRGHKYLVGSDTAHPLPSDGSDLPGGMGTVFPAVSAACQYVQDSFAGLSFVWRAEIIAADSATVLWRGTRAGRNGTGSKWDWREC